MKILVPSYETALGTAVHATPMLTALRELRPEWQVQLASAGLPRELFARHRGVAMIHATAHPVQHPVRAALDFFRIGCRHRFDAVLLNTGNVRPRVAWLTRFLRARRRIGVQVDPRFVDVAIDASADASVAVRNLHVLRPLLGDFDLRQFEQAFELYYSSAAARRAAEFRHSVPGNGPLIGMVTQTSGGQPSRWRDDRFVAVAKHLRLEHAARIVFLGTPAEAQAIDGLRRSLGTESISLAGQTSLSDIAPYCAVMDLLVTLDTGTMHVGRAVGVPMVVVAPAWQPASEWLPLDQPLSHVVRRWDIACRHCQKFSCASHECMEEISADMVLNAANRQLSRFPPNQGAWKRRLERWINTDRADGLELKVATPILSRPRRKETTRDL